MSVSCLLYEFLLWLYGFPSSFYYRTGQLCLNGQHHFLIPVCHCLTASTFQCFPWQPSEMQHGVINNNNKKNKNKNNDFTSMLCLMLLWVKTANSNTREHMLLHTLLMDMVEEDLLIFFTKYKWKYHSAKMHNYEPSGKGKKLKWAPKRALHHVFSTERALK